MDHIVKIVSIKINFFWIIKILEQILSEEGSRVAKLGLKVKLSSIASDKSCGSFFYD